MSINRSRREFLERAGCGFGQLALAYLLGSRISPAAPGSAPNSMAAKAPHFPATAKNVIFLFMHGGPSHLETFDPKPMLEKLEGKPVPDSFGEVQLPFSKFKEVPILASRRTFKKYGQAGVEISDLFPNVARHADELAVIRSCHHDGFTHTAALNWLNNGWPRLGRPSVGSWVVYGLGSESDSLPAFVVMLEGGIKSGPPVYSAGFLPAMYQGTVLRNGSTPILNTRPPAGMQPGEQREMLDLLKWYNEKHLASRDDDSDLSARIASYELAFRMQMAAPELTDLSKETAATKALYGLREPRTAEFGGRRWSERRQGDRRHRRDWPACCRLPGPCARCARQHPGADGSRPSKADISVPAPRLPADGRRGQHGPGSEAAHLNSLWGRAFLAASLPLGGLVFAHRQARRRVTSSARDSIQEGLGCLPPARLAGYWDRVPGPRG